MAVLPIVTAGLVPSPMIAAPAASYSGMTEAQTASGSPTTNVAIGSYRSAVFMPDTKVAGLANSKGMFFTATPTDLAASSAAALLIVQAGSLQDITAMVSP